MDKITHFVFFLPKWLWHARSITRDVSNVPSFQWSSFKSFFVLRVILLVKLIWAVLVSFNLMHHLDIQVATLLTALCRYALLWVQLQSFLWPTPQYRLRTWRLHYWLFWIFRWWREDTALVPGHFLVVHQQVYLSDPSVCLHIWYVRSITFDFNKG